MQVLKQSTAIEVKLGPFVDQTDGFTAETALTITSSEVLLAKNAGDWTAKTEATSLVHESNGFYRCLLDATDTGTLGMLMLQIAESGALPVWETFWVVTANVYDSLFSTDLLQVDSTQLLGTAYATPTVAGVPEVDVTHFVGNSGSAGNMNTIWGNMPLVGTADSGTTTTLVDTALTQTATDHFKGCQIVFLNGTAIRYQSRLITGFNPATDTLTFAPALTAGVTTEVYVILPANNVDLWGINGVAQTATLDTIKVETASLQTDTNDLQTRLPAALVSGRMDSSVGAMAANTLTASALASDAVVEIRAVASGTVDASTGTQMQDAARTEADVDYWKGNILLITSGVCVGEARMITAFDPTTDTMTVSPTFTQAELTVGATYEILPGNNPWSEDATGNQTAGSFGQTLGDSAGGSSVFTKVGDVETLVVGVQADTDNIQTRLPAALVGGRMDSSVGAMAANVLAAAATAADFIAEIKTQITDALSVDTYAEPGQGTPAATTTLAAKIGYLFKNWRNRKTETATQWNLYNDDAVTIDQKATVADDGTTASKTEIATGP